jgi:hypothetical protein
MAASNELPQSVRETATALMRWLRASRVEGVVIGGVAVSLLAEPRLTKDVDAVVWLESSEWERFLNSGKKHGFVPRYDAPLEFARQNRILLMTHEPTKTDLDLSLGGLPFEREAIDRAISIRLGRATIKLASPEDLMVMKAVASRPRDWADIESLLNSFPKTDIKRVRYWTSEFAAVLEAPEINDDLERLLQRWTDRNAE